MTVHIVDAVEREFKEKNKDKSMPDNYKSKAREMERALENFSSAARHLSEIRDIDLSGIKGEIKDVVDGMLR